MNFWVLLAWACFGNDLLLPLLTLGYTPSRPGSFQKETIIYFFSLISTNFRLEHVLIRDRISSMQTGISTIFWTYIQGQSSHEDPGKKKKNAPLASFQVKKLILGSLMWIWNLMLLVKNVIWIECCFSMKPAELLMISAGWILVFAVPSWTPKKNNSAESWKNNKR